MRRDISLTRRLPRVRLPWRRAGGPPDPAELEARVRECFLEVQHAWANRDGDALASYVTPALRSTMEEEFEELEARYLANRIADLELIDLSIGSPPAGDDRSFDAELSFTGREWVEDLRTGRPADGDPRTATRFDQRWHFVRGRGGSWLIDEVEPLEPGAG